MHIMIMKKLEILQELQKRDTEIWSEQVLLEDLLDAGLSQIFSL